MKDYAGTVIQNVNPYHKTFVNTAKGCISGTMCTKIEICERRRRIGLRKIIRISEIIAINLNRFLK